MTRTHREIPGAASTAKLRWTAINWRHCEATVLRLQMRIAKAVQSKRWGRVQALQHLLITSHSARLLAVRSVTTSKGKRTPGIDGVVWRTAQAKLQATQTLRSRGYKSSPLRRVLIRKSNGKMRPLGIPTMRDRAMQALHAMALIPIAEVQADIHSYGFRPHRSVADAIKQCHIVLSRRNCAPWILEGDIKACFDTIDHPWLKAHIPMDKRILHQWLKAGFMEKGALFPTDEGTPQGGVISPLLANMVLDGLQETVARVAPRGSKVNFVRYADDFICTAKDPTLLKDTIQPAIASFLAERGLTLSEEKTHITHIEDGFDFLGFNLRKYNGKLLSKPAKVKIQAFRRKLKECCRQLRYKPTHLVIAALNRKLRGWGNFYRHSCAKKIFGSIDHTLFQMIWRELKHRHPQKSATWNKAQYFTRVGSRDWILTGLERKGQQVRRHFLLPLNRVPILRHIKIKGVAHPFDSDFRFYLKKRKIILQALRARLKSKLTTTSAWYPVKGASSGNPAGSSPSMTLLLLEPYEGKLSRTVLRGRWSRKAPSLPD